MRFLTIACLSWASLTFFTIEWANGAVIGDLRGKHRPSEADAPHMAYLITASRINYPNERRAEEDLSRIRDGTTNFLEAMRRQQDFNKRNSRNREPQYSGDLGLLSYDQLDQKTSNILFDVRTPVSTTADKIIGPICSHDYGCSIYVVFQRFRRSFFSQAWLEADEYCLNNDLDFGQFLQGVNSEESRVFAARIWPDDISRFQRIKLQQVSSDLKRMKDGDPSTEPPKARRVASSHAELERAKQSMAERKRFFELFVTPELLRLHPEAQLMDIGELVRSGWLDPRKVRRLGFADYLKGGSVGNTEKPGTRMMYGTGGVQIDISAEAAKIGAADGGVEGRGEEKSAASTDMADSNNTDEIGCNGDKKVGGETPLDLDAIRRALAEEKEMASKAQAAEPIANEKALKPEPSDDFDDEF